MPVGERAKIERDITVEVESGAVDADWPARLIE